MVNDILELNQNDAQHNNTNRQTVTSTFTSIVWQKTVTESMQ